MQLQGNIAEKIRSFLNDKRFDTDLTENTNVDVEYPVLMPSVIYETVAESQMFFDEPWFNIEDDDREAEVARLFKHYCTAISLELNIEGVDMDKLFNLNRQTLYDDFPDAWDSPVAYELGEQVHLWVGNVHTWFLGVLQEDKELAIEICFGCFSAADMAKLTNHMTAFSER